MSEETIELFYIGYYEDPETGECEEDKQGVSLVSKEAYLRFLEETEWEPCVCNVQGCLSCFLDEKDLWADGFGHTSPCFGSVLTLQRAKHGTPKQSLLPVEERKSSASSTRGVTKELI